MTEMNECMDSTFGIFENCASYFINQLLAWKETYITYTLTNSHNVTCSFQMTEYHIRLI